MELQNVLLGEGRSLNKIGLYFLKCCVNNLDTEHYIYGGLIASTKGYFYNTYISVVRIKIHLEPYSLKMGLLFLKNSVVSYLIAYVK